ncbi:MAG TPA: chorismate-binding protein [Gemmatimonadaceae bacterium]|nr:chorismate-binding protein [Gemmatimonadaceae bacterium]
MLIPIWREIPFDLDTPVAAFAKLRRPPFSFLLESAPAGGESWSRFTYFGTEPRAAWRLSDGVVHEWTTERGWHAERRPVDPLADLESMLRRHPAADDDALTRACGGFWAGAVGYFGYDVVRYIERLPVAPRQALDVPDALFVLTRVLVVVDNLRSRAILVAAVPVPEGASDAVVRALREDAERDLDDAARRLNGPSVLQPLMDMADGVAPATGSSSRARADFERDVQRIREYIVAGDAFQVLLARRITLEHDFDTTDLYRALRALNPSPYMFHLQLDGMELVGSSPELLVRVQDNRVIVRPIAGTRRRDGTIQGDERLSRELLADEKERAEHLMLVDLGRNDVGRVASIGSVNVTELMVVERYSHVLHLVSEVQGRLRDGVSAMEALRATFPAGTMTGAPKVRAMEIIDELEPERRGPYAGAVGYIGADAGRMDLAITIRTCIVANGVASVQAGAGIVHDSIPSSEWEETESKARALLTAIARARALGEAPIAR